MTSEPLTSDGLSASERWRSLAAAIACLASYGLNIGLTHPLLSLILESRGVSRTVIGLNAAMSPLAVMCMAGLVPRVVAQVPVRAFMFTCIAADVVIFLMLPVFDTLSSWFVLRFLLGITGAGLFIVSETWINSVALDASRGRVMGLYATVLSGTFALGPLIIPLTGIEGWPPFLVGAIFIALAAVPLSFAGRFTPSMSGERPFGMVAFMFMAPTLAAAVLLTAVKEGAGMSLLPVFGVRSGLGAGAAAAMLTAVGLGGVFLQLPIGWIADHVSRPVLLIACAASGGVGAVALPLLMGAGPWLWVALFLWGGLFSGVYTVTMVIVGQRFRGAGLMVANAAFGVLWGAGALSGPVLGGAAMDLWDPHGLPLVLALASGLFVVLAVLRRRADAGGGRGQGQDG